MPQKVKMVAQSAWDDYLQNFPDNTTFWTLDDFIIRIGNAAADYYRQEWKRMYDEMRADRQAELIAFDPTSLSEQFVKMERKNGQFEGVIEKEAMSFPFDQWTSGYQIAFNAKDGKELQRSSVHETWNYQYQPYNNRLFWRVDRKKLIAFSKGMGNVQEVRLLYVPSIKIGDGDEEIPDGIVGAVIGATVTYMKELNAQTIIKKTNDLNQNKIIQTEINSAAIGT